MTPDFAQLEVVGDGEPSDEAIDALAKLLVDIALAELDCENEGKNIQDDADRHSA